MNEQDFRSVGQYEMGLLNALLTPSFAGRDELLAQVAVCKIKNFDDNGSFEFKVESPEHAAPTKYAVPTEGECEDEDGVVIHLLLHVRGDYLQELEIFREDNLKVIRRPNPDLLRVFAAQ